ncbi:pentatricopeptide repeat-containing protein At4g13650 [Eutrema salsugineum]|uniref:pentatricopeptide repeat-containing protein At4g13650 n=1 Tax=Eutrema salsugineum TaxID=72664 RepID=UPI000CECE97F|nr:pentatricopeptide repeat-containing protein At4g13650 [Eutrema salsugineum]
MFLRPLSSSFIILHVVPHKLKTRNVLHKFCEIRRITPISGFRTTCAAISLPLSDDESYQENKTPLKRIRPNHQTFIWLLVGCLKKNESLDEVRKLHAQILKLGFGNNASLCEKLLDFYLFKGDLDVSFKMFDEMPERTVFTWNKMIKELASRNLSDRILCLVSRMVNENVTPDEGTFTGVLEACRCCTVAFDVVEQIHARMIHQGLEDSTILCNLLIDLYSRNGFVDVARNVFDRLDKKDHSSWVAMISGLSKNDLEADAIRLFCDMYNLGIMPTPYAFSSVLSACKKIESLEIGEQLHGLVLKLGFSSDTYVCNALVSLYFHLGNLISAEHIFSNMAHRDAVTYNTLINGLSQCGFGEKAMELFKRMQLDGLEPDCNTLASLVIACSADGSLFRGQQVHAYTTKIGFASNNKIEGALLNLYAKCSDIETALDYFLETEVENVVLWNVMLVAYGLLDDLRNSFRIFRQMQMEEIVPNQYTYPSILKTCIRLGDLELGEQIHCQIVKTNFQLNGYVCSVLIDMYSKLGKLDTARDILVRFAGKDVVSWTTMIAGYTQYNFNDKALTTFRQMLDLGIQSDEVGLTNAISACAGLQSLKEGQQIQAKSCVSGFSSDLPLQNALVTLYSRCGKTEEAYLAFEQTEAGDNVAWNALVSGFQQSGNNEEAFRVFARMTREGIDSNNFTFGSAVKAASETANMKQGKQVHAVITKTGYDSETEVGNALISMYAKCGCISDAKKRFLELPTKNEVSWNAIINAYSKHGFGSEALDLFDQMIHSNIRPNHVTLVGVLSACSHIGLVGKGIEYFESMNTKYGLVPKPEHYVCVVDILTRAGLLSRAKEFIQEMPIEPDALVWRTLLSACVVHKNLEIGEFAARHLVELEPEDSATYVLLSNLYAVCRKWDARDQTRQKMKEKGVKKEPGQSWIEVKNSIHSFYVGDQNHPLADEIHEYFQDLTKRASEIGYVQDCFSLLNEAQQEQKDPTIFIHSEKLAISFGLLSLPGTIPINVMKNLRVCNDCHDWIKFVSKVSNREIIVRDAYRFHHFEGGACSCKDYW